MTLEQSTWIHAMVEAAVIADHIFPAMAACEAALESRYGQSQLAREGNNLFGLKAHKHNVYGVLSLPTHEFENSEWIEVTAEWEKYETLYQCFADRMETLTRLKDVYPEYGAALRAKSSEDYIILVSKRWSTDPNRAQKVLAIYMEAAQ
jgi:flagellum-specific peptidoglycan hydrolase FlgJ